MDSNRDMSKTVTVPGELHSAATGNVVAAAEEIFDYKTNSYQSDLNRDSLSYNVSVHHPEKDFYTFDEAVRLVPEEFRVGGLKLTFNSDSSIMETYFYNGLNSEGFFDENNWGSSVGKYIDSPEYIQVTLDKEDKVLEGIQQDGTKVIGGNLNVGNSANINGDIKVLGNMEISGVSYKVIENHEYLAAWLDANDKVIFGLKADGKTYVGDADFLNDIDDIKTFLQNITDKNIDWDALSSITAVNNSEYLKATTDAQGKILCGIKNDGTVYIPILDNPGIDSKLNKAIQEFNEKAQQIEDDIDAKLALYDEILSCFNLIEDTEGRSEITTDSEGRIISYRDSDGVKHECVGIETNSLNLTEEGMTEFQQALISSGFNPKSVIDWSEESYISIPEPSLAFINFTNIDGMPTTKSSDLHGTMEFWDHGGNYFKKNVIMNGQGNSTLGMVKKNCALDICNNIDWDDDNTTKIRFGNWVSQDSFHLKAFYTDYIRGLGEVLYNLWTEIQDSRGWMKNRTWKNTLIPDNISSTADDVVINDLNIGINDSAYCHPMAFPCIVYLNGEFYGIFAFQLKKHRDNYMQNKKDAKHIHLDGVVDSRTFFMANGDSSKIGWNPNADDREGFEIRNPKDLITMDGKKYDGELNLYQELIDNTSSKWDASNPKHVTSSKVKEYILNGSKVIPHLNEMLDNSSPEADIKAYIEAHYDVEQLIDYLIFSAVCYNGDDGGNNWQITTWDGFNKLSINPYDLDGCFGSCIYRWVCNVPNDFTVSIIDPNNPDLRNPMGWIWKYYKDEYKARFNELYHTLGIISPEHIISLICDWVNRIGYDFYKKEYEKWNESPCNRDPLINSDYWEQADKQWRNESNIPAWNSVSTFSKNELVVYNDVYYASLQNNNIGNTPNSSPLFWRTAYYENDRQYEVGDVVLSDVNSIVRFNGILFKCVQACIGEQLLTGTYTYFPVSLGYQDSIARHVKWIYNTIHVLDTNINNL